MKLLMIVLFSVPSITLAKEYSCLQLCEIKNWPEIKKEHDFVKEVASKWEADKKAKKLSRVTKSALNKKGRVGKHMIKQGQYYVSQLDNLNRQTTVINGAIKDAKKNKVTCSVISTGNHPYKAPGAKQVAFPEAVNHWESRLSRVTCYRAAVLEPFYNMYKDIVKALPKMAPKQKLEDKNFEKEFLKLKNKAFVGLKGEAKTAKSCPYSGVCKIVDKKEFAKSKLEKGIIKIIQAALKTKMSRPGRVGPRLMPILPKGPAPKAKGI